MGDSHGGAIELGLHRAVMGKMEFAGLQRSTCPWGPFNQCRQDRPGDAQEYHAAVNKLLVQNLRPGDVVSIIGVNNGHLNSDNGLQWYSNFCVADWRKPSTATGLCPFHVCTVCTCATSILRSHSGCRPRGNQHQSSQVCKRRGTCALLFARPALLLGTFLCHKLLQVGRARNQRACIC